MWWSQPNKLNTRPQNEQVHDLLSTAHRDFDALRWAGNGPVWVAGEAPETEIIALPWQCEYCGSVHPGDRLKCWDGVNGCGAPKPGWGEPPRGILYPRNRKASCDGGVAVRCLDGSVVRFDEESEPTLRITHHPGKSFEDFKLELGRRILAAYQKAIKCAL